MKTLLHVLLCCAILLGLHIAAKGQGKTIPAYVITVDSDTIQGQLLNEYTSKRISSIQFDKGNGLETYDTRSIKSYAIGDSAIFEAKDVSIDEVLSRAFLQVIVDGPTKLYYSRDLNSKGQFYIQKPGDPVIQLRKNTYESVLIGLLQDCDKREIEQNSVLNRSGSYSAKYLSKYVEAYNSCKYPDSGSKFYDNKFKVSARLEARAGAHFSNVSTTFDFPNYRLNDIQTGNGTTFGLGLNISFEEDYSVQPELLYTSRNYSGTIGYKQPNTSFGIKDTSSYNESFAIKAQYLQIPVLFKYNLTNNKLQPYLAGGFSFSMLMKQSADGRVVMKDGQEFDSAQFLNTTMHGFVGAVGIQKNILQGQRLMLELRYTTDATGSSFAGNIKFKNIYLMAGIAF